jgi:hypothetical protein
MCSYLLCFLCSYISDACACSHLHLLRTTYYDRRVGEARAGNNLVNLGCPLCIVYLRPMGMAKGGVEQCCPLGVPSDRKCPQPGPYVKTVFASSSIDDTCDAKAHVKAPHISTVDRGPDAQARARHGRLLRGAAAARLARPRGAHGLLAATSCSSDAIVLGSAPAAARRPAHDVWPLASSARLSTPSASTTTSGPSSPPTASLGGRCCAGAQRSAE